MQGNQRTEGKSKSKSKSKSKGKAKGNAKPDNDRECCVCGKKGYFARDCWSRPTHDKMVNEVEVENVNAEIGKEFVFTIEKRDQ